MLERMRHRDAARIAARAPAATGFDHLEGEHYCLVVSFRCSGEPVATPVVFGAHDGRLYFRSDATTAKVRRIRNNAAVLVGPCNSRGKPRGELAPGVARVVSPEEKDAAYAALKSNYTPGQRLGETMLDLLPVEIAYMEVSPA
jgi:PPOX class probable F420-dependent enzyme